MNRLIKRSVAGLSLLTLVAGTAGMAGAEVGGTITRTMQPVPINAPLNQWHGHWSEPALANLIERGLLGSRYVEDKRQTPEAQVTLAAAADLLLSIGRFPVAMDRNVIDEAVERGLIQATDFADEKIDPAVPVSRELFALWTARATGQMMMAEMAMIYMTPDLADADAIHGRYRNAVALLQEQGILAGNPDRQFLPQQTLTLAEGVQILANTQTALKAIEGKATGSYGAELPAASSPGRTVSFELKADGSFSLSTDYQNGEAPIVETGTWRPEHPNMLTLRFIAMDDKEFAEPITLPARLTEKGLNIIDDVRYGEEALQLTRR